MHRLDGHRPGLCRRWRRPVLLGVLCSVLLGACGSELGTSGPTAHRPQPEGSVGSAAPVGTPIGAVTDHSAASHQALSAWLAAERAFETAARTADAQEPALAATTTEPLIATTVRLLERMRAAGEVGRGLMQFGSHRSTMVSSRLALVHACGHDDELVVFVATGRPVPGLLGDFENERIVSLMALTATGWKLADQTVQEAPCE